MTPSLLPRSHGPAALAAGAPCETTPEISAAARQAAARTARTAARLALFIVPPCSFDGPRRRYAEDPDTGVSGPVQNGDKVVRRTRRSRAPCPQTKSPRVENDCEVDSKGGRNPCARTSVP